MKNSHNGFAPLILIIILAIAAVGGGVYYKYQKDREVAQSSSNTHSQATTTTQIAGWKTYIDSKNSYSFKYPSTDTLYDNNNGNVSLRAKSGSDSYLSVTVNFKSLDQTQNALPILSTSIDKINSTENITLNGIKWRKLIIAGNQVFLLTSKYSRTYVIQYSTLSTTEPIQDIITTFSFGAPNSNTSNSNWQTYSDPTNDFLIQHPYEFTLNSTSENNNSIQISYPDSSRQGTNLTNAFINIVTRKTDEKSCYAVDSVGNDLSPGLEKGKPAIVSMNGIDFHTSHTGDAAMGHYSNELYFNTYHNNLCYIISVTAVGAKQCFADAPDGPSCKNPLPSFNLDTQIIPIFTQIVDTFRFTK